MFEPTGDHHVMSVPSWMEAPKMLIRSRIVYQNTRVAGDGRVLGNSAGCNRELASDNHLGEAKTKSMMTTKLKADGQSHDGVGIETSRPILNQYGVMIQRRYSTCRSGLITPRRWISLHLLPEEVTRDTLT